ncbi:DUF2199 domain-containing protein [Hymenobacter wooponensis]|uniref:DUF2199 domain-containing protein n=1 Tax=Hymenobacter wooponensis TaxID=1525360 RepID=A0A4Z0MJT5_9BACT|nr:DUF2199 domain-containing protein [Hymenobacter wooponensis]TGD79766.1 DUF2199 domain-containing protein [Hymenobacter wooponensis]
MEGFTCTRCGEVHEDIPMCFGAEYPDYYFSVPPDERQLRIEHTGDFCVVDEEHFFIRARIEIPVVDSDELFCWNVWTSLSETNFLRANEKLNDPERVNEPAYFGWLQTAIPGYTNTLNIKTLVHTQVVGIIPRVEIIEENHPLIAEQQQGITWQRVIELAETALHG